MRSTDPITTHRQHGSNDIIIRHRIGQIFYPRRWSRQLKLIPFSRQNGQNTNQSETRCWTSDGDGGRGNLIIKRRTRKKADDNERFSAVSRHTIVLFPAKRNLNLIFKLIHSINELSRQRGSGENDGNPRARETTRARKNHHSFEHHERFAIINAPFEFLLNFFFSLTNSFIRHSVSSERSPAQHLGFTRKITRKMSNCNH